MMVDKTPPCVLVHGGIYPAIEFLEQETLEDVEANDKVDDEDDANDQGSERSELRNRLKLYMSNMGSFDRDGSPIDLR